MASRQLTRVLQHLRHLIGGAGGADASDGQLLARFVGQHDESAFRLLLDRYGPMVMGVCRRALTDPHAADDAFQATFLVLVRKAGSIEREELIGNWLYGVALRVARRARLQAVRRGQEPVEVPDMAATESANPVDTAEARRLLDEELQRLPTKYRVPMVLCYLEGKTNETTAQYLRCPTGTVKTRLAKGRELLRARLERRGLALSTGGLAALLASDAVNAAVPPALADATVQAATVSLLGSGGLGVVSASVAGLIEGTVREMVVGRVIAVLGMLLLAVAGVGAGLFTFRAFSAANDTPVLFHGEDGGLARTVDRQIHDWQPTKDERRFDDIGWARSLGEARRLARQHGRPIFLLTFTESIATGRCPASAFNVRCGALSHDGIIDLLNRAYVPVYLAMADYNRGGKASAEEKAELQGLQQEAVAQELSSRGNQVWLLNADGHLVNTLDACHAPADQLLKYLVDFLEPAAQGADTNAKPVVPPMPQSRLPEASPDALVLHLTARYLERQGTKLLPMRVALGKEVNYFMKGCPAENWIVLERPEWTKLLPVHAVGVGQAWVLDPTATVALFQHMYPATEDNNLARNRIDEGRLTATVVAIDGKVARARLEGVLRMKHRFDPDKDDNRFVNATLLGYLDFDLASQRLGSLRLFTPEATYGKNPFGVALRSVAR